MSGNETRVTRVSKIARGPNVDTAEYCLVQLYGPSWARSTPSSKVKTTPTIGRDEENFIVVDLDNVSRRHAQIVMRDGEVLRLGPQVDQRYLPQ